jgi:ABC-type dipeptide/oligopeptide/nickel transport system permease component
MLVFSMIHLLPGDPVQIMFATSGGTGQDMATFRHNLGLDQPIWIQYWHYLTNLLHGNLGVSITNEQPVLQKIGDQLMPSVELTVGGMVVAIVLGLGLGLLAGARPNSWVDSLATFISLLGVSIPGFLTAFFLILIFSLRLGWLPSVGTAGFDHLILPSVALGLGYAAILTRLLRGGLIEVRSMEYIRAARGRGVKSRRLLLVHMFRNALIPVVTFLPLQIGSMIGGAVIIENVFGRQGIGQLLVDSILNRDYPTVQGIVLIIAVTYVATNLIVDICYGIIDPRIAPNER